MKAFDHKEVEERIAHARRAERRGLITYYEFLSELISAGDFNYVTITSMPLSIAERAALSAHLNFEKEFKGPYDGQFLRLVNNRLQLAY